LPKYVKEGTILTTLDYTVPNNTKAIKGTQWENFLVADGTMEEFAEFLRNPKNELYPYLSFDNREKIIRELNSPTKVALFISQLFNPKLIKYKKSTTYTGLDFKEEHVKESVKKIMQIVEDINKAPLKYYYVHQIRKFNVAYIVPI
jgi:hypothetical protein